ncbi:MAG: tyrosine-protein phosphatase, partial [Pseudomonadota bacterium]
RAYFFYNLVDHGYLRIWWKNLHEIGPGVWRSNQPGPSRVRAYAAMGIKTILILRGRGNGTYLQLELKAARDTGMQVAFAGLSARSAAPAQRFLELLDAFETLERPLLMHCKSGADRAGIAAALYKLWSGESLAEARKMLSARYFHLKSVDTGILDVMLDHYEEDTAETPLDIRTWIATRYDRARLEAEFKAGRRHGKPWPRPKR